MIEIVCKAEGNDIRLSYKMKLDSKDILAFNLMNYHLIKNSTCFTGKIEIV